MSKQQARLSPLQPEHLREDQAALYQRITQGDRADGPQAFALTDEGGCLRGPFNAMLLSPAVGGPLEALGAAVRFATDLTDREREIAIICVAGHWESAFELEAHLALGRLAGLSATEIDDLRRGRPIEFDAPREQAVVDLVRELVRGRRLTNDHYQSGADSLGLPALFDLTVLVGYYELLALQLRVFNGEGP